MGEVVVVQLPLTLPVMSAVLEALGAVFPDARMVDHPAGHLAVEVETVVAGGQRFLTASEAAELRRRTTVYLGQERRSGGGPPFVVDGGRYLYPERELLQWLDERTVRPTNEENE